MLKINRRTFPLETEGQINRLNSEMTEYDRAFSDIAEGTIAQKCHAVGEYITVNGFFCEVTNGISVGEVIMIGRNVKQANIGTVLSKMNG